MHQRIPDLIHHGTIQLGLLTGHIQFHLLVQLLRQITDHSGELHYNAFDRYHSYLHYGFMQIGCHIFQIFDLLIECRIVAMVIAGSSYQRVFGNDQLTYEIHQRIQFLDVYTYSTVDHRLAHLFFLRSFSSRRLLLFSFQSLSRLLLLFSPVRVPVSPLRNDNSWSSPVPEPHRSPVRSRIRFPLP